MGLPLTGPGSQLAMEKGHQEPQKPSVPGRIHTWGCQEVTRVWAQTARKKGIPTKRELWGSTRGAGDGWHLSSTPKPADAPRPGRAGSGSCPQHHASAGHRAPTAGRTQQQIFPGEEADETPDPVFSVPPGRPRGLNKVWGPRTRHLQPKKGQTGPKKVPGPHAATPNRADPPAAHENNS